ncbi:MAG TPA: hypothetical protein VF713_22265 [Thermoanaerobaculia bacterium]
MNDLMERCAMLVRADHCEHEEILRELQHSPDPRFIPFVCEAIRLKPNLAYLEYDDYGAFYKKCLWVLQAIGTPAAVAAIDQCSRSDIPELKEQALHRLSRISEMKR